ncbi:fumarate hydratase [Desulfofundulus sp. TPOSR]|uniref:Fe-S type hydro-lyase tartrate/fumarate beta region n=1 Tax=Desulfofundulus kuznetsovii (strain DSM 6115 / VKM B-1805 / 17) TaxID=760568 RepID=A0AAU8PSP0_DESK7|nr:fumarate hydratase C-terminal domain-containing protein [Desulfofundulus sp. TPOSR]AEG16600.1 Fe-S type hydro-lyase tartrate/fumarate beta region [Desulfofundulus kuznetsovii DSM 6115]NHM28627.1 fumarate hydratase [Desulfofundulus sp. TPOSR]
MKIRTPVSAEIVRQLKVGDQVEISGSIYTGRDAVLPKLCRAIENGELPKLRLQLEGAVIFHTAVSPAGIGPTTSNKVEIEGSIPVLSRAGVRIHLGKGALSRQTVMALQETGAVFLVTPPVTALFMNNIRSSRVAAFPEDGMEAMHELVVEDLPAIVAIAHGESIF